MTTPYIPQEPGNPILAKDWNDMQTQIRDHITQHTHSGGENGVKLTGDAIDPGAAVQVAALTTKQLSAGATTIKGTLSVQGVQTQAGPLVVKGAAITPEVGNHANAGIQFPPDPGGGSGDDAFIRFFPVVGETTKLLIGVNNDVDDSIGLWQFGAERLTIHGGRVGVGTQTPQDLLHVRAPAGNIGLQIETGEADTDYSSIRFNGNGRAKSWIATHGRTGRLFIGNPAVNEALTVTAGNVGVRRSIAARALQIGGDENGIGIDPSDVSPNAGFVRFGDNTGWKLHFGRSKEAPNAALNTAGVAGVLMTLQDNGNLGLGTPAPSQRLELVGNLRVRGAVLAEPGLTSAAGIQFPADIGGGGGDEAFIRYGVTSGEATRLVIANANDTDDVIALQQFGRDRLVVRDGGVSIDATLANTGVALRVYAKSVANNWNGRIVAGGDGNTALLGDFNGTAVVGAHNNALNAWADLAVNPTAKTVIGSWTPDPSSTLTVDGRTIFRMPNATGAWDRLVVATTNEWGDAGAQFVTIGSGGAAGIMLSNAHVTWRDGRAAIRYGRTNGQAGATYWDAGVRSDASYSVIPYDGGADGSEKLKIRNSGEVLVRNNLFLGQAGNPLLISTNWSGYTSSGNNFAEISNDNNAYKALMLVGNSSSGTRKVGVWDRLEVNGTAHVTQSMTIAGTLGTNGFQPNSGGIFPAGWGGGVHTFDIVAEATILYGSNCFKNSTLRVKENIRPLTGCLAVIDRLTPVVYDHRDHKDSKNNYGFIAEEVRAVAPDVVLEIDPGQPNFFAASLSQDSLVALALAGVQELARKLTRLEMQVLGTRPDAPAIRDAIEVLSEQTHTSKAGLLEDYVAVRFTAEDPLVGARDVVRYLRIPPDLDRHEYLMGELKRWKHSLTA